MAISKAVALEHSFAESKLYEPSGVASASNLPSLPVHRAEERPSSQSRQSCKYCGGSHVPGAKHCPAAGKKCAKCSKIGHFAKVCMSKRSSHAKANMCEDIEEASVCVDISDSGDLDDVVYMAGGSSGPHDARFMITLSVNGRPVKGLLDTGATRTVFPTSVISADRPATRKLCAYGGEEITTLGMANVRISGNGKAALVCCFVVPDGKLPLFGQDVIAELGLVLLPVDVANVVNAPPVSIRTEAGAVPVAAPCRRHPFALRDEIAAELDRLCEAGVIESVKEASAWVSPIVPARKSNGKLRLCIDFRELNKHVVRERRQIPTFDEITAQIHGTSVFSVLDAESGFHQLELDEGSRSFTTFITHKGLFRFRRLPFGIASAPETFQRVLSDILDGVEGVYVYIDDILIVGKDPEEHDHRLKLVLDRLSAVNLRINWPKSQVRQAEVKYLGCILNSSGVHHDPTKAAAIRNMAAPTSLKDVRRMLGMVTYLGRFMPGLTATTEPLRKLAARTPFVVDDDLLSAFKACQEATATQLTSLAFFDVSPDRETAISSDASPIGLGAVLWQKDDQHQWRPVSCASRALTDTESRYSQLEREMLAVVFGLKKFQQYVIGRHVSVFTDHRPLVGIVSKPFDSVPARVQRWLMALLPFDYQLQFIPGVNMCTADALSRAPFTNHRRRSS